jgi:hypothetical protein
MDGVVEKGRAAVVAMDRDRAEGPMRGGGD